nr:J domain-containing protein [Halomonas llamarensis]
MVLGVDATSDDTTIARAYREAIKRHSPERDPQGFQAAQAAYEKIATRRKRLTFELFDAQPPTPEDLLDRTSPVKAPQRPSRALFSALLRGET